MIYRGDFKEPINSVVEVLHSLGAKEAHEVEEATHVIHMDVPDEIIDNCLLIYEDFEDVEGNVKSYFSISPSVIEPSTEDLSKKGIDIHSDSSKHTIESDVNDQAVHDVNYQWVYNCKNASMRLDESLFPIS